MLAWGLALIVAIDAGYYGIAARNWIWDNTGDSLRFPFDIGNGWERGMDIYRLAVDINNQQHPNQPSATNDHAKPPRKQPRNRVRLGRINRYGDLPKLTWAQWFNGFLADYDHTVAQHEEGDYGLDYSPLRLLIMSGWVKYTIDHHPGITQWRDDIVWPLLWLNTACEMLGAICAGLLAWLWARRAALARGQLPVFLGLMAYLLLWFNPAILLDAHVWPQWEVWVIAAYLLAALLLSLDWPLAAGMVIAVGCMMKGQMLLTAPLLVLWPLFAGKWWTALRVVLGCAFAAVLLVSPWLLVDRTLAWQVAGATGLVVLILLPLPMAIRRLRQPLVFLRVAWLSIITIATIGIIFCAWHFNGSMSWYKVGFEYGTRHFPVMTMGPSMNLPLVLHEAYDWNPHDPVGLLMLGGDSWQWPVDIRQLLIFAYIVSLLLCSIAAAIHDHRKNARILIAIAAPWVLFFALLAQMHNRYLIWACGITAIAAGVSFGMTLLHLLITFLSMLMILPSLLSTHLYNALTNGWPKDWPHMLTDYLPFPRKLNEYINSAEPGLGWVTLLVAMVFLVYSCTPSPRKRAGN